MAVATWLQASALRLDMTTLAPCSARRSTIALPMPFVEPVTSATFPVRSKRLIAILYQRCPGLCTRRTRHGERRLGLEPPGDGAGEPVVCERSWGTSAPT